MRQEVISKRQLFSRFSVDSTYKVKKDPCVFSLNVGPRNMAENLTFAVKVAVDPIQSVWNCSGHGKVCGIAVDMAKCLEL